VRDLPAVLVTSGGPVLTPGRPVGPGGMGGADIGATGGPVLGCGCSNVG